MDDKKKKAMKPVTKCLFGVPDTHAKPRTFTYERRQAMGSSSSRPPLSQAKSTTGKSRRPPRLPQSTAGKISTSTGKVCEKTTAAFRANIRGKYSPSSKSAPTSPVAGKCAGISTPKSGVSSVHSVPTTPVAGKSAGKSLTSTPGSKSRVSSARSVSASIVKSAPTTPVAARKSGIPTPKSGGKVASVGGKRATTTSSATKTGGPASAFKTGRPASANKTGRPASAPKTSRPASAAGPTSTRMTRSRSAQKANQNTNQE